MKFIIQNSVFASETADPNLGYVRDYLRDVVKHLTGRGMRRDSLVDRLTSEILGLHKANPFRDPVDEAALLDDLASIHSVQVRVNNLVDWLERGIERGERAREDAARDAEFP